MKHLKKICYMLLLLVLLVMISACGSSSNSGQTEQEKNENTDTANEKQHDLIISHHLPGNHIIHTDVLEYLANTLNEKSNGRIRSDIYPGAALGAPGSQYDMAATGELDIALSVHGFTPGRFPLVSVVELPFFSDSAEKVSEILQTLYEEFPEIQEEHSDVIPLWIFSAEPAQILSVNKPIEKVEDMQGLRVRTPSPMGNEIIEALGATPVSIPMGEVYDALHRGVVDAAMAPFSAFNDFNLMEVAQYITVGNFSATPFYSVMNIDSFNSMSAADQELIKSLSGMEMAKLSGERFDFSGNRAIEVGKERGVTFIELSGEDLAPWREVLQPIYDKWIQDREAEGLPGQAIYDRALELAKELE